MVRINVRIERGRCGGLLPRGIIVNCSARIKFKEKQTDEGHLPTACFWWEFNAQQWSFPTLPFDEL